MAGTLYFGPGPGASWPLTVPVVETALAGRFPSARFVRRTMPTDGSPYLRFEIDLPDGMTRKGTYGANGVLALSEGTPEIWAETIAWYLSLLPPSTPVYAMVEESGAEPVRLPPEAISSADLVSFLHTIS